MSVTGHADGDPMRVGIALSDLMSGMNAAYAILAATIHPAPAWHLRGHAIG